MNINLKQVIKNLSGISLDTLAKETGFVKSKAQKITPLYFVASFFACVGRQQISLSKWANALMCLTGVSVSKEGLNKRLSADRHADFCRELLAKAMAAKASAAMSRISRLGLEFNNIFLQDSSSLSLPKGCELNFPGPHSNDGEKKATGKIQLTMDLLNDNPVDILLSNFRKNDQGDALRIVDKLEQGDLLVRDLGYFVLRALKAISSKGAYFLSRLKPSAHVYLPGQEVPFGLLEYCKAKKKAGAAQFELAVEVGKKERVPVRLLVQQVPQGQYQKRRRKALKDRHKSANHDSRYLDMLQWQFLVTNAEPEKISIAQAFVVYQLRWRIEIIFKAWKSGLKLQHMFAGLGHIKPARASAMIFLMLTYLVLFVYPAFQAVQQKASKALSFMKWVNYLAANPLQNLQQLTEDIWVAHIERNCAYEARRRKNHGDLIAKLKNG